MPQPKSILITGCSEGGLGDCLAQEFHRRGLRVFATARTLSKMGHLKTMGVDIMTLEVTSPTSIAEAVERVSSQTGGRLDYLFNNSGLGYSMPVTDIDIEEAKKVFDVNFFGVIAVTQGFMPLLMRAHGTVINNTSVASIAPVPIQSIYNASKAALHSLTRGMRVEFQPLGVKVIEAVTGKVASKFFDNAYKASEDWGLPEDSLYSAATQEVESIMAGNTADGKHLKEMDAEVFAKKVAGDVLKSNPPIVLWRGASASLIWLVTSFLSHRIQDFMLVQAIGFGLISSKVSRRKS